MVGRFFTSLLRHKFTKSLNERENSPSKRGGSSRASKRFIFMGSWLWYGVIPVAISYAVIPIDHISCLSSFSTLGFPFITSGAIQYGARATLSKRVASPNDPPTAKSHNLTSPLSDNNTLEAFRLR